MGKNLKYVGFDDGQYVFADLGDGDCMSHEEIVEGYQISHPKAKPVSAAYVSVYEQYFIIRQYSNPLNMGYDEKDSANFMDIFEVPSYQDRVI